MKIVEEFLSIQGEGKFQGSIAYFIRFGGCNLNCIGFNCKLKSPKTGEILIGCDTIKAVKINHFDHKDFDPKETLDNIFKLSFKPLIVITGGEPLIHHKDEEFYKFIITLLDLGYIVQFESNGTIFVDFENFPRYKDCIYALSIKLSNSGVKKSSRIKFNALKNFKDNASFFYKFVINEKSADEVFEILSIVDNETFCMPVGKDRYELSANAKFVFEFCVKFGFNYSDRLHIRIFDNLEGV